MLLFLAFTLALSSIPTEEVSLGINPETSPGMQNALMSDAFSRLDTNQDGSLTKAERKPLFDDSYVMIAQLYVTEDEPSTVTKAKFVATVAVPDMANTQDPTEHDCLLEAALVQISADDIWRHLYGDKDSVSVPEFASAMYDAMEKDIPMNLIQFIDAFTTPHGRFPFAPNADNEMHIYKLDSYTELHNPKCQSQRRNLLVSLGDFCISCGLPSVPLSSWDIMEPVVSVASVASQYCTYSFFMYLDNYCSVYNLFTGNDYYMPWYTTTWSIMDSFWNSWTFDESIFIVGRRQLREKMAEAVQRKI